MAYPKPDRSDFRPNLEKADIDDVLDLGLGEGVMSDGRPFRVECWAQHGATLLTFFFSAVDMDGAGDDELLCRLLAEGLLQIVRNREPLVRAERVVDVAGNELWSVNVVIGGDEGIRMRDCHPLQRY